MCVCVSISIYTYLFISKYVYMYIYIYIYLHIYAYVYHHTRCTQPPIPSCWQQQCFATRWMLKLFRLLKPSRHRFMGFCMYTAKEW